MNKQTTRGDNITCLVDVKITSLFFSDQILKMICLFSCKMLHYVSQLVISSVI